jgi:ADP-ribose pyrophosphatase
MQHSNYKTLSSEIVHKNPYYFIRKDEFINPDGKNGTYYILDGFRGVMIVPIDKEGNIYFIREYRYVVGKTVIELPAGRVDGDEDSEISAKRELKEETGLISNEFIQIGKYFNGVGHETLTMTVFIAKDVNTQELNKGSDMAQENIDHVFKLSIKEAKDFIKKGKIECGLTIASLNYYFLYLEKIV